MKAITVQLKIDEIILGVVIGVMRHIRNEKCGYQHKYGMTDDKSWQGHIQGALGELVFAKYLGVYWTGNLGDLRSPDVAEFEVRSTASHENRLIVHKPDADDRRFYLVTGKMVTWKIHGWILGRDGKQDRWWEDPQNKNRWAYFVPHKALNPLDDEYCNVKWEQVTQDEQNA